MEEIFSLILCLGRVKREIFSNKNINILKWGILCNYRVDFSLNGSVHLVNSHFILYKTALSKKIKFSMAYYKTLWPFKRRDVDLHEMHNHIKTHYLRKKNYHYIIWKSRLTNINLYVNFHNTYNSSFF